MKIAENLITQYKEALKERDRLSNLKVEHDTQCTTEVNKIHWKYNDKKRELDIRCNKEKAVVEKRKNKYAEKIDTQIKPFVDTIIFVKNIFEYFELFLNNRELEVPYKLFNKEDSWSKENVTEVVDIIGHDQYKRVWIYIVPSKKPKNKYSLRMKRKSIFNSVKRSGDVSILKGLPDIEQLNKWYGDVSILKDLPDIEQLKKWYEKNKNDIKCKWGSHHFHLNEYLNTHANIEKEYEECKELWKEKKWQRAYWLDKKECYETQYSGGKYTDEYHDILLILKTSHENTPLLMGQMKSDLGKKELERRLLNE